MTTATIAGLIAFIESQPADRAIKSHSSWNECAVGDYAREVLNHTIPRPNGSDYSPVWADPVVHALYMECGTEEPSSITFAHGVPHAESTTLMDMLAETDGARTYGDLLAEINSL